jgi:histidyl-tRNA synthetase
MYIVRGLNYYTGAIFGGATQTVSMDPSVAEDVMMI